MSERKPHVAWSIRDGDLARELRGFAIAYPVDCFFPVTDEELKQHGGLVTRASAAMGRHFAPLFIAAANEIERLAKRLEIDSTPYDGIATRDETIRLLEKERDELRNSISDGDARAKHFAEKWNKAMDDADMELAKHKRIEHAERACALQLRAALERARGCIKGLLARTPVRDVSETLAEIDAALGKNPNPSGSTSSSGDSPSVESVGAGPDTPLTVGIPPIRLDFITEIFGTRVYRCERCDCSFTYDPKTHKCEGEKP